ncbi:ABC-type dipeptide/oligopeptide/nickel transport system, permease component [Arthrobacter sp. PAMC 25486]|uniref:ABC transporter permease n=1 Tax=Arthrobacter sp. PAMC 25486 TaxID=1494608 RepID=UPI0005359C42|nr:ABC transporter permease [Arthrobacter sp. PAMC 25486]AIY02287.1 ABC-type dipeptide/oligopeptide/nickel transport system, permease component [Arthrobacter sp. PAMC 25486]
MDSAGASFAQRARTILNFAAPKLLQFVFVIWATYTVTFLLIHFLPGDPVLAALSLKGGDATTTDPAALERLRVQYGLDGSLWTQYFRHLGGVLTGDFGTSISTGQPVATMIGRVIPHSAAIAGLALVIGIFLAVLVTYLAYLTRSNWLRQTLMQIPPLGVAIPAFLTGLILISVLSFGLGWFPSSGTRHPLSVVLPSVTLALPVGAIFFQVFSAAVFEAANGAYVFTAVAKGLSPRRIFTRHVLRNSLLASITILGLQIGYLAGGTAVVETVFSRDGIGRMTVDAVLSRDINVIQGVVIVVAIVYSLVNLIVDLCYGLIDPRIRPSLTTKKTLGTKATPDAPKPTGPTDPARSEA